MLMDVLQIEEAIAAEPDLSPDEARWLKASCYDCYDMLVCCDEFVNQVRDS